MAEREGQDERHRWAPDSDRGAILGWPPVGYLLLAFRLEPGAEAHPEAAASAVTVAHSETCASAVAVTETGAVPDRKSVV